MTALLAFDTSTERMAVGLAVGDRTWEHETQGGALASAGLVPTILSLLRGAGVGLAELDAIAFGRGPGAFTGLRTACSVAQGLALGASKPVLPIDTLQAVAEDARDAAQNVPSLWVAMDARMDQIYAAHYQYARQHWQVLAAPMLIDVDALNLVWAVHPPLRIAGNAAAAFAGRLLTGVARCQPLASPRAAALLSLARLLWQQGGAVDAGLALPSYVREKVAQTIDERAAMRRIAASPQ